jgi:hypothetical protein
MIKECACGFTQTHKRYCEKCYHAAYRARPGHRKKNRDAARKWRKAHPKQKAMQARKWRVNNPEKNLEVSRNYRATHRDAEAATKHRRRIRLLGIEGGSYTVAEWQTLKALYGNRCLGCGRTEEALATLGLKIVPDHVIPIMKGGSNTIDNIQPLCHHLIAGIAGCNEYKNDKIIDYRRKTNVGVPPVRNGIP